jgi:predicted RND superfamily exporter protein
MRRGVDKSLIIVEIMTLVMVVVWVGFGIYMAYTKVAAPTDLEKYLKPLTPSLKTTVLDTLESRSP